MASRTTTEPAPDVEYDFDSWDEQAEAAALAALAGSFKYIIVEGAFVGRFGDGDVVRIPLEFNLDVLDGLDETAAPVDQLRQILAALGDQATADRILKQPVTQVATCASVYFTLVQKVTEQSISKLQQVRLGE